MRRVATLVALAAAALVFTGCTELGIAEFDREQLDSDKLDLPARYLEDPTFDPDSIRWLANDDGVDFYAARGAVGTCVILVRNGDVDGSVAGCGASELRLSGRDFPSVRLYIDATPPVTPEGMTKLTPNLFVEG